MPYYATLKPTKLPDPGRLCDPCLPLHASALPALFPVGTYSLIRTLSKSCKALYELFGQRNVMKIHLFFNFIRETKEGSERRENRMIFIWLFEIKLCGVLTRSINGINEIYKSSHTAHMKDACKYYRERIQLYILERSIMLGQITK